MATITEFTQVVRNPSVPTGEVDGELVTLDLERGSCFGMNRIGTEIWGMAETPLTVGEIADALTRSHAVDRAQCVADILPFVEDLVSEGLLRRL